MLLKNDLTTYVAANKFVIMFHCALLLLWLLTATQLDNDHFQAHASS